MEQDALAALYALAERRRFGMKPGLDTIRSLLERLGNPEQELATIHIAGTNGKGAVSALCESVLRAAGYPVARYTSPHLLRLNERFLLRGKPAEDALLGDCAGRVLKVVEQYEAESDTPVTFFEALTAVAFLLFKTAGTRLAVVETGLGGRLDATNVLTPLVTVITRIGLDHCARLGDTVEKIAGEKAGIIKPGRPVVCGMMPDEARRVILQKAQSLGSKFIPAEEMTGIRSSRRTLHGQNLKITTQNRTLPLVHFPLAGAFQVENAMTAVAALETVEMCGLPISDEAMAKGMEQVFWPGRFQLLHESPSVVVDGAHNPDGAHALLGALKSCGIKQKIGLIAGFCGDKDVLEHLRTLLPVIHTAWSVQIKNPRSLTADRAAGMMRMAGMERVTSVGALPEAWKLAEAWAQENNGLVLICGSLFLAGEAICLFHPEWGAGRFDPSECL